MLSHFRKIQNSFIIKFILALTALSFMSLFGISSYLKPDNIGRDAITIGSKSISAEEIRIDFDREIKRLSAFYGNDFDSETAVKAGLLDTIIKNTVSRTILDLAGKKFGNLLS